MMDDSSRTLEGSTQATPPLKSGIATTPLEWTASFPETWNVQWAGRLLGLFLIFIGAVGMVTEKAALAAFAGMMVVLLLSPRFLPVTYRLSSEGIRQNSLGRSRFKPWSDFQSAELCGRALQLTPKQSFFRGRSRIVLSIPLGQIDDVFEKLQRLMPLRLTSNSK